MDGKHVKVLVRGNAIKLGNPDRVHAFLGLAVERLGMRELTEARVIDVPLQVQALGAVPFEDEGGVTAEGFGVVRVVRGSVRQLAVSWLAGLAEVAPALVGSVVLSTSHVAIHTWPLRRIAVVDAYSCRDFDEELLAELAQGWFDADRVLVRDLSWALSWDEPE
jgi:hypothetical protein